MVSPLFVVRRRKRITDDDLLVLPLYEICPEDRVAIFRGEHF
jgi:hypothetical protein